MARSRSTRNGQRTSARNVATIASSASSVQSRRPSTSKTTLSKSLPSTTVDRSSKNPLRFRLTLRHKIAAMIWLSVIIVILMTVFRQAIAQLGSWGYVGAFIINGISSATVVLPAPGGAIVLLMAADYHPLLLGIAAGLGGTVGSLTAYVVGAQARPAFRRRRLYDPAYRMMHRFGYVILFILTLPPVSPGDFGGILAGATGYPVRKFLVAVGVASVIKMVALTYGAAASLAWLERWLPF